MKKIITIITILFSSFSAFSQNGSGNASQSAQLNMSDAIDITFVNSGSATGNAVTLNFGSTNDLQNGITSAAQELKVRSNKNFKVSVKIDLSTFSYTGSGNLATATVPTNAMELKVASNNTGGNIASPFSTASFATVNTIDQDLVINGVKGNDQRFAVQYKCNPGFNMPAGTYSFDMVYTATQL